MPATRADAAAYVAYVRAEAMAALSAAGMPRVHPSLVRENRWRACRYGMQATIIDPFTEELLPVTEWLERRLEYLAGCGIDGDELEIVARQIPGWRRQGGGAELQRRLYGNRSAFPAMIRAMCEQDGWHG